MHTRIHTMLQRICTMGNEECPQYFHSRLGDKTSRSRSHLLQKRTRVAHAQALQRLVGLSRQKHADVEADLAGGCQVHSWARKLCNFPFIGFIIWFESLLSRPRETFEPGFLSSALCIGMVLLCCASAVLRHDFFIWSRNKNLIKYLLNYGSVH